MPSLSLCLRTLAIGLASSLTIGAEHLHAQASSITAVQLSEAFHSLPTTPPTNREILTKDHVAIKVARVDHRVGPGEVHLSEDRVFYVTKGSASICTGGTLVNPKEIRTGENQAQGIKGCISIAMQPGSLIVVPRGTPYQMRAADSTVEYLVIRTQ